MEHDLTQGTFVLFKLSELALELKEFGHAMDFKFLQAFGTHTGAATASQTTARPYVPMIHLLVFIHLQKRSAEWFG